MKPLGQLALVFVSLRLLTAAPGDGPDPAQWDAVVKKYVDEQSRVDYRGLKRNGLNELDAFLREVATRWPSTMSATARKAALINAYNALTVRWVLTNYPVESIMKTPDPFKSERHTVDGRKVSLDQVESELREMKDPRVHSVLVCAARSCPPLRREAYVAERLEAQLDENTRAWLANSRLNEFAGDRGVALISPIFKWYAEDFGTTQDLKAFLARYSPGVPGGFLLAPGTRVEFMDYDWGLNDASALGGDYSQWSLYWDLAVHNPAVRWRVLTGVGTLIAGSLWFVVRRRTKARTASRA